MEFQGRNPKGHTRELSRIIFNCKHIWMAWAWGTYYAKVIIMYLSIVLDNVLGATSPKTTLRFLVFH